MSLAVYILDTLTGAWPLNLAEVQLITYLNAALGPVYTIFGFGPWL